MHRSPTRANRHRRRYKECSRNFHRGEGEGPATPGRYPVKSLLTITATSGTVTTRRDSASRLVIATPVMPHGVISSNRARSPQTLSAKPCIDIQCRTPTPMEAIFRSTTHVPVRPSRRRAAAPSRRRRGSGVPPARRSGADPARAGGDREWDNRQAGQGHGKWLDRRDWSG